MRLDWLTFSFSKFKNQLEKIILGVSVEGKLNNFKYHHFFVNFKKKKTILFVENICSLIISNAFFLEFVSLQSKGVLSF